MNPPFMRLKLIQQRKKHIKYKDFKKNFEMIPNQNGNTIEKNSKKYIKLNCAKE